MRRNVRQRSAKPVRNLPEEAGRREREDRIAARGHPDAGHNVPSAEAPNKTKLFSGGLSSAMVVFTLEQG